MKHALIGAAVICSLTGASLVVANSAGAAASVAATVKGVDPGAADTNRAGHTQATGVIMHRITPAEAAAATQPKDVTLLGAGGCTPGYGKGAVCLPITPPSAGAMGMTVTQMPWTCAEVRTLIPAGIVLNNPVKDPAHLDVNKDGIACGAGD